MLVRPVMTSRLWRYPPDFVEALLPFGLAPREWTPPVLVREALGDLYKYELRRERDRLRAGRVDRVAYLEIVVGLRKKYWPLTLQPGAWEKICSP
jgi:hypothetical protein